MPGPALSSPWMTPDEMFLAWDAVIGFGHRAGNNQPEGHGHKPLCRMCGKHLSDLGVAARKAKAKK